MKKTISLLMLLTLCLHASAQRVTKDAAQAKAVEFLNQQRAYPTKKVGVVLLPTTASLTDKVSRQKKAPSLEEQVEAPYYIFNASDSRGYVIVSGDERMREVLGYSAVGSITENDMPENLCALLDYYAKELDYLRSNPSITLSMAPRSKNRTSISALVTSKWNQSSPYNYYCPSGCPTGCVATAMAQILYYWAKKGNDIHATDIPGYITTTNKRNMSPLSATSFAWNLMTNSYSSSVTESGKAVAKLMQYCGTALKMDYTSGGSNAWGADQVPAMTEYFGMDKGMKYIHRPDFTFDEWDDMMYKEMSEGRPVLYGGCGYQSGWGGHAFVMDGYDATTDTYHFNFGWGGSSDGYFALTALKPSNYDFNAYVDAVVFIQPDKSTLAEEFPFKMSVVDITYSGKSSFVRNHRSEDFEGVSIFNAIFDYQNLTKDVDLGLGLFSESGEMIKLLATKHVGHYEPQDGFGLEFCFENLAFGAELPFGNYYIKAISKESSSDVWLVDGRSERHYITASLQEKELLLTPSVELVVSSFSGKTAVVRNLGTEEATSNLYIFRNNNLSTSVQEAIPADGQDHNIQFSYYSGYASNVKICSDKYGRNILYSNYTTDNIAVDGFVERTLGSARHIDHFLQLRNPAYTDGLWSVVDSKNYIIGNQLSLHLLVTNKSLENSYSGPLQVVLSKGSSTVKTSSVACDIASGKTDDLLCVFDDLSYGSTYSVQIKSNGNSLITSSSEITYIPKKGIVVYKKDGTYDCVFDEDLEDYEMSDDVVCIDATWSDVLNELKASENPNCLYILAKESSVPNSLQGKNLVIDNQAERIELYDGYNFGSPISFVAKNITYSRLMSEGYGGENVQWGGICVPFSVDEITVDGKSIDWFHNSSETGKNLWIMDFVEDNGSDILYFNHAQTLEAYKPYILTAATDNWGKEWQLTGKTIVFEGHDASIRPMIKEESSDFPKGVSSSTCYDFVGRSVQYEHSDYYSLNGDHFSQISNSIDNPFDVYVVDYVGTESQGDNNLLIVVKSGQMGSPTTTAFLLGDVNLDGSVTIADVTATVNILLGKADEEWNKENADMDGDGEITIADVTALVNIILGKAQN